MTLYQIKPLFQSLLRPTMFWLHKLQVSANQITLAALALSLRFVVGVGAISWHVSAIAHRAFCPYGTQCAGWHDGA